MGRPNKYDYSEAEHRFLNGESVYQIAKDMGITSATLYHHLRAAGLYDVPKEVLEKLGNPILKQGAWGSVYITDGLPGNAYRFVTRLTDKTALESVGAFELCDIGLGASITPLFTIVANVVKLSDDMKTALEGCGITILLKGEL